MKIEIKFRACNEGKMIYQNQTIMTANNDQLWWFFKSIRKDAILMQFTGLKDKNGVDIYEGDILESGEGISFVVWGLDGWRFNSWMPNGMNLYSAVDTTTNKDIAEIIGNIYENPELLNK